MATRQGLALAPPVATKTACPRCRYVLPLRRQRSNASRPILRLRRVRIEVDLHDVAVRIGAAREHAVESETEVRLVEVLARGMIARGEMQMPDFRAHALSLQPETPVVTSPTGLARGARADGSHASGS
jgi:hypothetical protein